MAGLDDGYPIKFRSNSRYSLDIQPEPEPGSRSSRFEPNLSEPLSVARPQFIIKPREVGSKAGNSKYFRLSLQLVSAFCENVLAHPFVVLKRQCQVNPNGLRRHIVPLTLIPIIIRIQSRQGLGTLWKGIGSVFIVKGLAIVFEDALYKLTQWPKDTKGVSTIQKLFQHLFLKFISAALVTPFYSACLTETVQSDIASEKPGIFDCLVEGVARTIPSKTSFTSRILPVWTLAFPTAAYSLLHYTVTTVVQRGVSIAWRYRKSRANAISELEDETESEYVEMTSFILGHMVSDMLLFPLETVVNRLHVQGTRTIIDNLDTGYEVTPIITKYEGVMDCFQTIMATEKAPGFFKGIGAVMLQYAIYFAVLKLSKFIFNELKSSRAQGLSSEIRKR